MKLTKPVTQKNELGCGVACVAFILQIPYSKALALFKENKTTTKGYTCKDICLALKESHVEYKTRYIGKKKTTYQNLSIIYIRKNLIHKYGHYLCKTRRGFMDPFLNLEKTNGDYLQAISGFRKKLPGKAIYEIYRLGN